uniref:Uncharacterized protein n=1 Tax=Branchiostoma floridae TaxID=7739 RepID=C3ZIR7_BRAFL|eukprot:XP_002591591.1 hypothetical protein BRAFLDRAFT_108433 [Branchiostoma floridae]
MAKPKVCSVCTLPVKGHRGPHGRGKCTAGFSPGSDNNSDSIEERVRRSLKKLKRDSKAKELAKGLWSEASEEERVPTARDLREDDDLADRVDKTLDEIFGKKPRKRSSSRRKDRKDTSQSPSRSRSPDAARSRRRLKNIDDLLGKRPVSSRKRSSSDSTTSSSTSRSRSTDGSRSRRSRSNDHKGHRRRHRSARRRYSSDSRSSSSPRRRRRGKKSGRTKTINDSASSRVKIEWPHHHVHFPGKGKGGDGCVTYDDLSTSMFVHGFVKNLLEKKHVKRSVRIRLEHLSDLMFDAAYYDWGISDAWKRNIPRLSADMARDPFVSPLVTTQGEPPVSLHSRVPLAPGEDIIELYTAVAQTGVPNYIGARIPVKTSLNIPVWRALLANYSNTSLPDFLEFGWPINIHPENYNFPQNVHHSNHRSALDYQADVDLFIDKELRYGAMCGPFRANPFPFPVFPAPLQTVAKRDSDTRRVVVDLSYPSGQQVNPEYLLETFPDVINQFQVIILINGRIRGYSITDDGYQEIDEDYEDANHEDSEVDRANISVRLQDFFSNKPEQISP